MARHIDADELAQKLQGFTLHSGPNDLMMECLDCGGVFDVACPDSEIGDAHVNLNTLMLAAADHSCDLPDMQCVGCCAVAEEREEEIAEEVERGIMELEAMLDQQKEEE